MSYPIFGRSKKETAMLSKQGRLYELKTSAILWHLSKVVKKICQSRMKEEPRQNQTICYKLEDNFRCHKLEENNLEEEQSDGVYPREWSHDNTDYAAQLQAIDLDDQGNWPFHGFNSNVACAGELDRHILHNAESSTARGEGKGGRESV